MARDDATSTASPGSEDDFDASVTSIGALAEPLRRELYRFVVAQPEPVSRDEAAAGTGVARHVAKFHLEKLVEEGLLDVAHRRPPGRGGPGAGRPAKVYRRSERELAVTLPPRRYEFAGQLLARGITDATRDGVPVSTALKSAVLERGEPSDGAREELSQGDHPGAPDLQDAAMRALDEAGFEPRWDSTGITLTNCPFDSLAQDFTDLACGMNLDLMTGFLAGLEGAELDTTLDPAPNRCCVRLRLRGR